VRVRQHDVPRATASRRLEPSSHQPIDARIAWDETTAAAASRLAAARRQLPAGVGQHTVSVVIPTYNEARNIAWVLRRLPAVDEVILVDGRSTDATVAVARAIRPDIRVVFETTPGKGAALRAGFTAARGDLVLMIDADGSMNPAEIERFIQLLSAGHQFVKGSRFLPGGGTTDMTPLRRLGNHALMTVANILYGRRFSDLCYGYCGFERQSLLALGLDADGFEIETQICVRAAKAGLRTAEVPSFESPRMNGESNLNTFRDGWRVLMTILRERVGGLRPGTRSVDAASGFAPIRILSDDE
jgi:glycosyltransferase involved in cell wall biosynthesis